MSTPTSKSGSPNAPKGDDLSEGLSILDMAGLPPLQLRVMRLVLRGVELSYSGLCEAVDKLPEAERLGRAQLDETLGDLIKQQWVTLQSGRYKANLHRKSNRTVSDFAVPRQKRQGSTLRSIWDNLERGGGAGAGAKKDDSK